MCSPVSVLLRVILTITCAIWSVKTEFCPAQNRTDETRFTIELGSRDYVRLYHSVAIPCCAEGYEDISWYKNENGTWSSFPPPSRVHDYNHPEVQENGQILRFYSPNLTDGASYRCDVRGKSKDLQHTTDLGVVACDPMARGPIQTAPFPQNQTIYQYGGNITFPCTGYFGCSEDQQLQLVLWMVEGINSTIEEISPRYSVHEWTSMSHFTKQKHFTITDVQAEDIQRTFICVLATPQEIHGQTRMKVKIVKKENPKFPVLMIGLITGGCVLFVLVLIIIGLSLRCRYGPQIRLYFSSRISRLGPKTIDNENYIYNLFIYHAEEDEKKAQSIKAYLSENNYKVYITADIQGNLNKMHTFFEKTAKSAMVLFLFSDALKNDELANFFLQSLVTERKGKDIMFLEAADYKPKDVMNWTRNAKNVNELQEGNLGLRQRINAIENNEINDGRSIEENDGIDEEANGEHKKEEVIDKKEELANDLHYWEVLPRIKVPKDDKNERKMANFWCSLRNEIPKFEEQKQKSQLTRRNKQRHSSSRKPLLESTGENEATSPLSLASNTGEFSPDSNEVFKYEESNEVVQQRTQENRIQNLAGSGKETVSVTAGQNPENDPMAVHTANRLNAQAENGIIRGEIDTERNNEFLYVADVHHKESSVIPGPGNVANPNEYRDYSQNVHENQSDDEVEASAGETVVKSKEYIFTMSDEELKTKSSDSESGYSGMNRSGRGTAYPFSESGESSRHEGLSSQSSGFSDFNSEGSVSPPNMHMQCNNLAHAHVRGQTHQKLPNAAVKPNGHLDIENTELMDGNKTERLVAKGQSSRNQSFGSPESGYNTSPSERILSNGAFLPEIKENLEREVDNVVENK